MSDNGFQSATVPLSFKKAMDLLSKDQAKDLVRAINKFMKEFQRRAPDASVDAQTTQEFYIQMESTVHKHPLFQGAQPADVEEFMEAVERYSLIKLYERTFRRSPEDIERDELLTSRMAALQFVRPEHLEISPKLVNENFNQSLQLAEKALVNMNMYKAPRDKLVCILNCCRVINNLLSQTGDIAGADDFTPILIYTVIRAQPQNLASNLAFIERYRMQSRLVSEAHYYFVQLSSAAAFIETLNANSLKVERDEFIAHMLQYGAMTEEELLLGSSTPTRRSNSVSQPPQQLPQQPAAAAVAKSEEPVVVTPERSKPSQTLSDSLPPLPIPSMSPSIPGILEPAPPPPPAPKTLAELEEDGVKLLIDEEASGQLHKKYKFLYTSLDDLMVGDVQVLLSDYKEIALKYEMLRLAVEQQASEAAKQLQAASQPATAATAGSTTPQPVQQLLDAWSAADDNAPVLMTNLPQPLPNNFNSGIVLAPPSTTTDKATMPNSTTTGTPFETRLPTNETTPSAPVPTSPRTNSATDTNGEVSTSGREGESREEGDQTGEATLSPTIDSAAAVVNLIEVKMPSNTPQLDTAGDTPSTPTAAPKPVSPAVTPTIGLRRPEPVAAPEDDALSPTGPRVTPGLPTPVIDHLS